MELLGENVETYKKNINFNEIIAYDILLQMLESIKNIHDKGYIHRDIKPQNFVMSNDNEPGKKHKTVYLVDFGLSKVHLDTNKKPLLARTDADFRGTLNYASLNAHLKKVNF